MSSLVVFAKICAPLMELPLLNCSPFDIVVPGVFLSLDPFTQEPVAVSLLVKGWADQNTIGLSKADFEALHEHYAQAVEPDMAVLAMATDIAAFLRFCTQDPTRPAALVAQDKEHLARLISVMLNMCGLGPLVGTSKELKLRDPADKDSYTIFEVEGVIRADGWVYGLSFSLEEKLSEEQPWLMLKMVSSALSPTRLGVVSDPQSVKVEGDYLKELLGAMFRLALSFKADRLKWAIAESCGVRVKAAVVGDNVNRLTVSQSEGEYPRYLVDVEEIWSIFGYDKRWSAELWVIKNDHTGTVPESLYRISGRGSESLTTALLGKVANNFTH